MQRRPSPRSRGLIVLLLLAAPLRAAEDPAASGELPRAADGRPLNLDFEAGDLRDWTADGDAFAGGPVEGDAVAKRRSDMRSRHAGRFWVGSFERDGDKPRGSLTSVPFTLTKPWASFLVAGGSGPETRVEIVREDTGDVVFRTVGDGTEELKREVVDLTKSVGKPLRVRLVDNASGGWGHLNFDDFRLHDARPNVPPRPGSAPPDEYAHAGLDPEAAARAMTVPKGFKVTLFASEPDVVQPVAMTIDARGRLWVAEAYSYPRRVPEDQAKDRILIFEDRDNDGRFDTRKVFADRLNLVSGLEVGFGGAWVGAAPNLMFIPDADGDDTPDGPPQILLDGWGYQDTHETLNSFLWGPDGWLYGCHGVFTHSNVGKPGAPASERTPINAGIWRYHPTRHEFEVFAHGTSNPWGVDFDANGQCFIEACVIPHLYHMIQGGRYERQAGAHFNPYTYDDIKTIADHRHYVGANPHAGNNRSDSMGGGHAHAGLMIYDGGRWPEAYRGGLFMNNIHGARLNHDVVTPKGSGFVGSHRPDFLLANDVWSQVVYFRSGADGNAYLIDWYDKNQCHRNETEVHDRTNGRVFQVRYDGPPGLSYRPKGAADLAKASERELIDHVLQAQLVIDGNRVRLATPNNWYSRTARRVLQQRGLTPGARAYLSQLLETGSIPGIGGSSPPNATPLDEVRRLNILWTLHAAGGLDEKTIRVGLAADSAYLRAWTVQLACETRQLSSETLATFATLAKSDPSPVVRLYLASAVQRLPEPFNPAKWAILEGLVAHEEDADDPNLPLMVWYAAEPLVAADPARGAKLAAGAKLPRFLDFTTRRIAAIGTDETIALLVAQLGDLAREAGPARRPAPKLSLLAGMNEALKGRRQVAMPAGWPSAFAALAKDAEPQVRAQATALALTFGDRAALASLREVLADGKAAVEARREALASLLRVKDPALPATLRSLLADPAIRVGALRGLAAYDDAATAPAVLAIYPELDPAERRDALTTLASRPATAKALLAAVGAKRVAATDLSADVIRNLRNLKDPELDEGIAKVWGAVRDTPEDKLKRIAAYRDAIRGQGPAPDPSLGRVVWAKTCGACHTLFGVGGAVGPDLTGSNRADLDYILTNVMDPSALVGKDYQATVLATTDGRVITGLLKAEDANAVTLATATETVTVPKDEVEERKLTDQSLMPEDQWTPLTPHEVRSLVAYLASPGQVPLRATAENAATFFNGKDLAGWIGDPALWSVQGGEIVGKSAGLAHNAFLRSDLAAGDFRLTLKVKLAKDEGNSGVQFRSEPLPDGEMKGYQADVGPGWWGKLYEENGRGLLWERSSEAHVKPGEWNEYEIVATGPKLQTRINGHLCVDLDDPAGARRGVFALQLHSGGATEVRFKDVKLEVLDR
jgi:putative membrane-bound dehydrogenase-like protein